MLIVVYRITFSCGFTNDVIYNIKNMVSCVYIPYFQTCFLRLKNCFPSKWEEFGWLLLPKPSIASSNRVWRINFWNFDNSSFNVCWKTQTCHWYHKRKNSAINNNETTLDPRRRIFFHSRFMNVLKSPLLLYIDQEQCAWVIYWKFWIITNYGESDRSMAWYSHGYDIFIYYTFHYMTKRIPLCK